LNLHNVPSFFYKVTVEFTPLQIFAIAKICRCRELADVKHERKVMDDIHAHLLDKSHPLRHWFYGHYHQSWNAEIDGVVYDMLDTMDLRELR